MKAVIFDFDYTLGDSTNGIAISVNYALSKLGYGASDIEQIKRTIGLSLKDTYFVLTNDKSQEKAGLFSRYFKEKADEVMVDNTVLYNDVKNVMFGLRERGYKLAIVTTKYHYRIEQILNRYYCRELVNVIVGAEDVKIEKPNPEGILQAIKDLGTEKANVLYIGDSLIDAKTAENAQVNFIAVLTGTTTKMEFQNYDNLCVCKDITDVFHYILALEQWVRWERNCASH